MKLFEQPLEVEEPPHTIGGRGKSRESKYARLIRTLPKGKWFAVGEGKSVSLNAMGSILRKKFPACDFAARTNGTRGQSVLYIKRRR